MENRIQSIDIFRALTMLLMIWVNDFWTLENVPFWLQHMPAEVDGLGFSDIIFPAFLVIVGLSIPFALESRLRKGQATRTIVIHISIRSLSLLFMGVLMVNLENYGEENAFLPQWLWQIAMITGFFLVWNDYPPAFKLKRTLQAIGWILLILIAALFRSNADSGYRWIEPHWWGILGLIGWSYLICSLCCLVAKNKPLAVFGTWIFFSLFNIAAFASWLEPLSPIRNYVWIVGDGSMPALTLSGCLISSLYLARKKSSKPMAFFAATLALGILCLALGFGLRPLWGISKIGATPAWTQICAGIALICFALLFWIADVKKATRWAIFLKPAGVATLTCYLVPYLAYPLRGLVGLRLPEALRAGFPGLLSSALFALLIVALVGILLRFRVKLKL